MVLSFASVDEISKCYHSNESYWAVFSIGAIYYAVQGGSNICDCGWNSKVLPFNWKLLSSTFIALYKMVLNFESVVEILKCDHSIQSYWAVLSCGAVCYAVQCGSNVWVWGWHLRVQPFKWKLLSSILLWYSILCCRSWFLIERLRARAT